MIVSCLRGNQDTIMSFYKYAGTFALVLATPILTYGADDTIEALKKQIQELDQANAVISATGIIPASGNQLVYADVSIVAGAAPATTQLYFRALWTGCERRRSQLRRRLQPGRSN